MSVVDDIKGRLDIVDLVSSYAPLTRSGTSYKANCPFHSERTPSFHVFPERQTWRCFGACAQGGDVFSFWMRINNLEFTEALRQLAQQTGVALSENPGRRKERNSLHDVNEAAAEYFSSLLASSKLGAEARAYLEERGLNKDTVKEFQIGLSPAGGDAARDHLSARGFGEEVIALAGLVTKGRGDTYRDMFRGRLMFPIRDGDGKLVGFGGRSMDGNEPKYLNSPKTPVFDKGNILYGIHLAKGAALKQGIVIVEGYVDAVACHQAGYSNVVASMGTALAPGQVSQVCGLLPRPGSGEKGRVTLALDADAAGQEATLRGLQVLWEAVHQGKGRSTNRPYAASEVPDINVLVLPDGQDPDEVVLEDSQAWPRLIEEAVPLLDYRFSAEAARIDMSTPGGKSALAGVLMPLISATSDPFQQDHYFQKLASMLGVSEATLKASVELSRPRAASRGGRARQPEASATPFDRLEHDPMEEHCLALLLQEREWISGDVQVDSEGYWLPEVAGGLRPEHFRRVENREVFTNWTKCSTLESLQWALDDELGAHLEHLLEKALPPMDRKVRESDLLNCIRRLEERYLRELKHEEALRLNEASLDDLQEQQDAILDTNERMRQVFQP